MARKQIKRKGNTKKPHKKETKYYRKTEKANRKE